MRKYGLTEMVIGMVESLNNGRNHLDEVSQGSRTDSRSQGSYVDQVYVRKLYVYRCNREQLEGRTCDDCIQCE